MPPTELVEPTPVPEFNEEDFNRYFEFLSDNEARSRTEVYCYSLMDEGSTAPIKGYGVLHGTSEEIRWNLHSFVDVTLHLVLNTTNLKGRKRADIQGVRVFCLDIDTPITREHLKEIKEPLAPQLIVESSPDKYHVYWKASPTIDLETWSKIQAGLAHKFSGDTALSQITHMIRVPGVRRVCKDGELFLPKIIYDSGNRSEYGLQECLIQFGLDVVEIGSAALKEKKKSKKELGEVVRQFSSGKLNIAEIAVHIGKNGKRNEGIYEATNSYVYGAGVRGGLYPDMGEPIVSDLNAYDFALALNALLASPLEDYEIEKTARSAWQHARESLFKKKEKKEQTVKEEDSLVGQLSHGGTDGTVGTDELEVEWPSLTHIKTPGVGQQAGRSAFPYDFTGVSMFYDRFCEAALSERVTQRFYSSLAYHGENLQAYTPLTVQWIQQKTEKHVIIREMVLACIQDMVQEKEFIAQFKNKKGVVNKAAYTKEVRYLLRTSTINNIYRALVNSSSVRRVTYAEWEHNPDVFHAINGIVDLKTLELREATQEDMLLVRSPTVWDDKAECPKWLEFLEEVFRLNSKPLEMIEFIREVFAYSLGGRIQEEKLFCYLGGGSNGKSTILDTLKTIMGDYVAVLMPDDMTVAKGGYGKQLERINVELRAGKRLGIVDDFNMGGTWNEGFIKNLTNPSLVQRLLYQERTTEPNRAKFHIGMNKAPLPQEENEGIFRRLCFIPFGVKFPVNATKKLELAEMMKREASGILLWAAQKYKKVVEEGITYPVETLAALEVYKKDNSVCVSVIPELYAIPTEESPENDAKGAVWLPLKVVADEIDSYNAEQGKEVQRVHMKSLGAAFTQEGAVKEVKRSELADNNVTHVYLIRRLKNP